jgi:hypothetical protein
LVTVNCKYFIQIGSRIIYLNVIIQVTFPKGFKSTFTTSE